MPEGSDPTIEFQPEDTAVLDQVDRSRTTVVALMGLAIAAGAFLIGIAVASTTGRDTVDGTLLSRMQVGPSGGTVRFAGGEIRIPSGALASSTTISVNRVPVRERVRVRPPGRATQVFDPGELQAYVFEPADLDFRRPVTLVFRPTGRIGDATAFARIGETTLFLNGGIDAERGIVAVEVSDFGFRRGTPVASQR